MAMNSSGLNLTTHRAEASVWDRRGWDGSRRDIAVTRWLVGVGGAALAIQGLRHRSATGSMLAGIGGSLAWWAATGQGDLSDARKWFISTLERFGWRTDDLMVQDASTDSFPASDAPAWTAVGTGVRHQRRA